MSLAFWHQIQCLLVHKAFAKLHGGYGFLRTCATLPHYALRALARSPLGCLFLYLVFWNGVMAMRSLDTSPGKIRIQKYSSSFDLVIPNLLVFPIVRQSQVFRCRFVFVQLSLAWIQPWNDISFWVSSKPWIFQLEEKPPVWSQGANPSQAFPPPTECMQWNRSKYFPLFTQGFEILRE